MAQKVQFISTVMHEPRLIILDEPFSGFDPVNAQLITKEILELKEHGSTIIFSTHRMETVEDLCDHIALIDKSRKILEGSKKQVKQAYRSNTYWVEHKGAFGSLPGGFDVLEQKLADDDLYRSVVKAADNQSPNLLIRELTATTEVHSFIEKIPTMSEIFINLVKGGSDE
jgi:ABC-2 type transport system ATP-binding protein